VSRWLRRVALLSLLALSTSCGANRAVAAQTISAVNVAAAEGLPPEMLGQQLAAMHANGVSVVRSDAPWGLIQPRRPSPAGPGWRWARTDYWVTAFARHDLTWEPILDYSAGWAKLCAGFCAPTVNSTYAAFARAVAARYGQRGSFWSEHPGLPRRPARVFEIWNEENVPAYSVAPERYASLYASARQAIRAVDPSASVIVGGLADDSGPFSPRSDYPSRYVRAMFAAQPGLVGHVDGFGLHPYGASGVDVEEWTAHFRQTLDRLGEGSAPIDITEFGWHIGGPHGESWRAEQMRLVARGLSRSNCGIRLLAPYDWINPPGLPGLDFGLAGAAQGHVVLRPAGAAWFRTLKARDPELRLCP
jgi:polysaccharide biosynthesis protein PslG